MLHDAMRLDEIILDPKGNQYYTAWQYTISKPPFIQHAIPEHVELRRMKEEELRRNELETLMIEVGDAYPKVNADSLHDAAQNQDDKTETLLRNMRLEKLKAEAMAMIQAHQGGKFSKR